MQLMDDLSQAGGVEAVVEHSLSGIVEKIGGTDAQLYYFTGGQIHFADLFHCNKIIPAIVTSHKVLLAA